MNVSELIQPRHLSRQAMIYVRQSTMQQVVTRQESSKLQYAMRERAIGLGWQEQSIEIVDIDLGRTATTTDSRIGFQHLVSRVALGKVGVVIAYDATRLARNCTHWYELLDLCGRADCLIADRDGVYDPCSINGRLLLGLKGQISELELHTIRSRLLAGKLSKAKRGELAMPLPTGFVRVDDDCVEKHPDREVQDRITLVFRMMLEKKSVCQLVRYLNGSGLGIPRRSRADAEEIVWRRANIANIGAIVSNPTYAGAYVFGRRKQTGGPNKTQSHIVLPRSQWQVFIPDKYPSYVSWSEFEKIETMLHDNYAEYNRNKTRGVPRDGQTLLQGIIYCGRCGHKMGVQFKGGPQYLCNRLRQINPGDPVCQRFASDQIDNQVSAWFFEALSESEIDASQETLSQADRESELLASSWRQQLTRLRYQAQRTERQFQKADPENRLVAAELERRWEEALRELKAEEDRQAEAMNQAPVWAIPSDLIDKLKDTGRRLPELWRQGLFTTAQKKALLRSLIDKVVLERIGGSEGDRVHTRVVWKGGATTCDDVKIRVAKISQLENAAELEREVIRLSRLKFSAPKIAIELTAKGFRSPKSDSVLTSTVRLIRKRNGFLHAAKSRPVSAAGYLTVPQLSKRLNIRRGWFHEQIREGNIQIKKDASTRCYLFPDTSQTLEELRQLREGKLTNLVY